MKFMQVSKSLALQRLGNRELPASFDQARRSSNRLATVAFRSVLVAIVLVLCGFSARTANAQSSAFGCTPAMANDIVCENSKTGNPPSDWQITGAGDMTIQGFATDISVNQGQTISFKINTDAKAYTIEIYRIGYYQPGTGARRITSFSPSVSLPQTQPPCFTNATTNLYDCGTWAVSASWQVPSNATSGVYIAHLIRQDTGGDSHIVFIVRNDSSHSPLLYQTSDESWLAYNDYGGHSVYGPTGVFDLTNRAYEVSLNRPFTTRGFQDEAATWVFGAEFAMIQWLEQNGYDVTYTTGLDAARNGSLIKNHKVFMSSGHDEYWSGPQRTSVEAARDAGVDLAFFSGNEIFWKTRWENSSDGTNTPYRTMACYKETLAGAKIDPSDPPTWTGTWRDPRFSPPADGGKPENALSGTIFMVNGPGSDNKGLSMLVPAADGKMRFWRNTTVATQSAGQTYTLPAGSLGYEWDVDADNGFRPAGTFDLSTSTYGLTSNYLLDYGATYGAGTATHHMVMYKAPSGALVFGAGTVQWSWGLNDNHDNPFGFGSGTDVNMQQATVNLFADMGVQPASIQSGLVLATASTDTIAPTSTITFPKAGSTVTTGSAITITGTATDSGGGVVGGVEISLDGGTTWHPTTGRGSWSYTWLPAQQGSVTLKSRAVDDSANLETPSSGITFTVVPHDCPCSGFPASATPTTVDSLDGTSGEFGVKFRTDYDGYITSLRFYKASTNTGQHVGNIWSSTGTLLGSAVFTTETASGWQQVTFANPVAVSANTTYVASYFAPVGHYSADVSYFTNTSIDIPPLHYPADGKYGLNGTFSYGATSTFPTSGFAGTNYWVDVTFIPSGSMTGAPPALLTNPTKLNFAAYVGQPAPASQTINIYNEGTGVLNWTATKNASWLTLSPGSGSTASNLSVSVNASGLASGTYTDTITISSSGATNAPQTVSVTLVVTNLLLSSNFSDGTFQGYAASPLGLAANWSVSNQTLQYSGGGPTQLYAGNSAWADYTVSAQIKLSNMNNYPGGIRGRVNPATGAGYIAWLYPATGAIRLFKNTTWSIDAGATLLGSSIIGEDTVNFHTLALSFVGTQIQVLYDGRVVITATDTTSSSGLIALDVYSQPVTFANILATSNTPNGGSYTTSTNSLSYSATYLGSNPAPQTVSLTGSGGTLAWTAVSNASWLSVSPSSGITPASLQVSVNSSTLAGGTYTGTIQVVSLGAVSTTQTINVSLTVTVPPPTLVVSPTSLSFSATQGQAAPPAQSLGIINGGTGSIPWTATSDSSWLVVSAGSGSTPAAINVSVLPTGLATGHFTGNITVTSSGVANSPQTIPVTLLIEAQDMTENFSDLGSGWIVWPTANAAGWTASNNVFSYNGAGLSVACAGNSAWTDYSFDAGIKLSNLSNWPGGIRGRVNPTTGAGYVVWLYPGYGTAVLYKVGNWNINDSSLTQLAQASMTYDTSATHDLRLNFSGSQVTVSWDSKQIMSVTDTSYTAGYACLDADSQPISYSNVIVKAVQSQVKLDTPSPASLVFNAMPGATAASQNVNISAGGASTTWAVTSNQSWLTTTVSTTLTPGVITVTANAAGLSEGTYNGTLTVSAPGASNTPITIPVTLAVKTAVMSVSPTSMTFFGAVGLNPNSQSSQITNVGTGSLNWTANTSSSWLGLSPASGTAPGTVTLSPSTSSLVTGSYSGTVNVSSTDVGNSPQQVSVSMQVGNLLFSDNFSGGAGNWTIGPLGNASGWSVGSGGYSYSGAGPTQAYAGNTTTWTDYTVAADVKLSSLSNYPGGLRGRVNTSTGSAYVAWIYPAQGLIRLFRVGQWSIDTGNTLLGTSSALTMDTNVHNLRMCFHGSTIQVYYDNVLVITATDTTYTQGAVALDVYNQPITFNNVTVISLP